MLRPWQINMKKNTSPNRRGIFRVEWNKVNLRSVGVKPWIQESAFLWPDGGAHSCHIPVHFRMSMTHCVIWFLISPFTHSSLNPSVLAAGSCQYSLFDPKHNKDWRKPPNAGSVCSHRQCIVEKCSAESVRWRNPLWFWPFAEGVQVKSSWR